MNHKGCNQWGFYSPILKKILKSIQQCSRSFCFHLSGAGNGWFWRLVVFLFPIRPWYWFLDFVLDSQANFQPVYIQGQWLQHPTGTVPILCGIWTHTWCRLVKIGLPIAQWESIMSNSINPAVGILNYHSKNHSYSSWPDCTHKTGKSLKKSRKRADSIKESTFIGHNMNFNCRQEWFLIVADHSGRRFLQ